MSEWRFAGGEARNGQPCLWLVQGSRRLAVHSPLDPEREARALVSAQGEPRGILLLLGGGLGIAARLARQAGWQAVIRLEPPRATGDLPPDEALDHHNLRLAGTAEQLVDLITREQLERGFPDLHLVVNGAYRVAFPEWSEGILEHFRPGANPSRLGALREHNRRESGDTGRIRHQPRVLVLQSGYFLLRECCRAFRQLGCEVREVPLCQAGHRIAPGAVHQELKVDGDFLNRLLAQLSSFRPDLVFCVNHIGFDGEGRLASILETLGIPVAVWYVDSPVYILDGHHGIATPNTQLFVWERHWLPAMERLPFGGVHWLPLAGNEDFLKTAAGAGPPTRGLSFVGGSNTGAVEKWQARLGLSAARRREYTRLLEDWVLEGRHQPAEEFLADRRPGLPLLESALDERGWRTLASLLVLEGTQRDRLELCRAFGHEDFVVCGDRGWQQLDPGLRLLPGPDYHDGLPLHYASCRVNLNSTSRQMPTALNQRAFDVPLCGTVVLGDHQADLDLLFEPGRDCLAYRSPEEALELARRLLRDETGRQRLAAAARETVMQRHLYRHRVEELLRLSLTKPITPAAAPWTRVPQEEPCRSL
jgi:spore maturation protein CgeB